MTLLRYPGGKSRAIKHILPLIPKGIDKLCSPFFGGGAIELAAAKTGINVYGYDLFYPVTAFWDAVKNNTDVLKTAIRGYYPINKDTFYDLQKRLPEMRGVEAAAMFFVLNRASFSGSTLSGGMSPGAPRFTENAINKIDASLMQNIEIAQKPFTESILQHSNDFMYLDPPYMIKCNLYGTKGDLHVTFDHEALYESLQNTRGGWILSYNDCPEIRKLYQKYDIRPLEWRYGMSKDTRGKELIIMNV